MSNVLTLSDLDTRVNGEPRVSHHRLSAALAYGSPHKMAHLVKRHMETLYKFGLIPSTVDRILKDKAKSAGRPGKTYWLNKKQALYLCTKSEAPLATETTIQMVEVFDAWREGHLVTTATQDDLAPGFMRGRVGRRDILVDTRDFRIGPGDEALVYGQEGKIEIMRGPLESGLTGHNGARAVAGHWVKPGPNSMIGVSRERGYYQVIGRLVQAGERRRRLAA